MQKINITAGTRRALADWNRKQSGCGMKETGKNLDGSYTIEIDDEVYARIIEHGADPEHVLRTMLGMKAN
jgi:hypothetical protein